VSGVELVEKILLLDFVVAHVMFYGWMLKTSIIRLMKHWKDV